MIHSENRAAIHSDIDLESIIRTLYDEMNFQRDLDFRLCGVLATILPDMKRRGLIARFGAEDDVLHYVTDDMDNYSTVESYSTLFDKKVLGAGRRSRNYFWGDPSEILIVDLALGIRDEYGKPLRGTRTSNYCVFLGARALERNFISALEDQDLQPIDHRAYLEYILISYGINSAFQFRKKIFANFPPPLNKQYWTTAATRPLRKLKQASARFSVIAEIEPPWAKGGQRRTVTLSLDMRRSTFAMDQSTDPKAYADWIEAFVLILQRLTRENFGVFDKFTGDGVLIHFLADECRHFIPSSAELRRALVATAGWRSEASSTGQLATHSAVKCAFEMIWAIQYHMTRLRQILSLNNKNLGPAVGIAINQAQWSVDRDGGLIVVGRGLVQACRVTADTPRGRVRVTDHAAEMFREIHKDVASRTIPFASKEFPEGSGVTAEEMKTPPAGLCRTLEQIHSVVEDVWRDLDGRSMSSMEREYG